MTLELNEKQQQLLDLFKASVQQDIDVKRMPLNDLSELALGAEIAAKVRTRGGALDDVVLAMSDRVRHEQRRRMVNNPRLAEQLLEAAGLGMTEDDVVANNKLAEAEQKAFGVGSFEEDVDMRRSSADIVW